MTDLTEFLEQRIAEDEALARAVLFTAAESRDFDGPGWYGVDYNGSENAEHGARWKPERVLADCAAKRQIVESARRASEAGAQAVMTSYEDARDQTYEDVLEVLASVYADHPDFRSEWAL